MIGDGPGFKPLLDECAFSLGTTEEAAGPDEPKSIHVYYDGSKFTHDAIGMDEQAGTTLLFGFDWMEPDPDKIRQQALDMGAAEEEIDAEISQLVGERELVLSTVYPWENVRISTVGGVQRIFK